MGYDFVTRHNGRTITLTVPSYEVTEDFQTPLCVRKRANIIRFIYVLFGWHRGIEAQHTDGDFPKACRRYIIQIKLKCIPVNMFIQCSTYIEARVCRAPSLVSTAPTLCGKRGPPSAPHFCAPCIKHQTLNSQVFLKSQRLFL